MKTVTIVLIGMKIQYGSQLLVVLYLNQLAFANLFTEEKKAGLNLCREKKQADLEKKFLP